MDGSNGAFTTPGARQSQMDARAGGTAPFTKSEPHARLDENHVLTHLGHKDF